MDSSFVLITTAALAVVAVAIVSARAWGLARQLRRTSELLVHADQRLLALTNAAQTLGALASPDEWLTLPSRSALDALWDWDVLADRMRFSARWREMIGMAPEEVHRSAEEWWGRIHPSDAAQLHADVAAQLASSERRFSSEHRVRHENGSWLMVQWGGAIVRDEDGRAIRVTGSVRDTTAQRDAEERQRRDSFYDSLTGLPNRALSLDLIRRAIRRTQRQGERRFAALYVDLDRFNLLNDSLGHQAGDELLRGVSQRLGTAVRPGDVVSRIGGDEFLLLLDEISDFTDAESVADRVKIVLSEPVRVFKHEVVVSASIGIVLHDPTVESPAEYLRDSELAMHAAKRAGRARYERFAPEMRAGVRRRVSLEQDMRGAVERGEFALLYQPIWSLSGPAEQLLGFEALIRWNHPLKGTLAPGEFVPIAEETDSIVELGEWALQRACEDAITFSPNREGAPWVSVNVAARQLTGRGLALAVDRILLSTELAPVRLKLEVTENVILHDEDGTRQILETLKARGVSALMDDFGTGHASLSYLHRLPIGTLKIDRYFVGRMDVSQECLEIVRSIVALARSLGLEVVAEGVEQEAQLRQLREFGCQAVQGFLLSRPLLAEEAHALIAALDRDPGGCPRGALRELGMSGGHRISTGTSVVEDVTS